MNYDEAIQYIHSTLWKGSRLGLVRMTELADKMGNPQKCMKFVHIAGTNGKGSTAAILASIFKESGYSTGLFTSPYVTKFTERIQINGAPIPEEELAFETEYVKPFAESMEDKPTEFELVTAIAFSYFKRKKCDLVVLEVGMGGALDSTNVIDVPELAVITAIGMDHMAQLGNTIEEITQAKAGIIKPNGEVIAYDNGAAINKLLSAVSIEKNAHMTLADFSAITNHGFNDKYQVFSWGPYKELELSLLGNFQQKNAALALSSVQILSQRGWNLPEDAIRKGLKSVHWPGRFEMLAHNPLFILDGGHNPHGTAATAESIESMYPGQKFIFLTGVMADKDIDGLFSPLLHLAKAFITVTPNNPRAMDSVKLSQTLKDMGAEAYPCKTVIDGVNMVKSISAKSIPICAIGSLYMASSIREIVL